MDLKKAITLLAAEFNKLKAKYGRNKDYFFTSSMTEDMPRVQANRRRLEAARTPAERLEFVNSFNSRI